MQKILACVAMLLAGTLAGCGKDKHREPAAAGYETEPRGHSVPTKVARAEPIESEEQLDFESQWREEPAMTPASGATQGMTPASGTQPGATPGTELEGATLGTGGPIILQYEGANHLAMAICKHEQDCGRVGPTEAWCEEVVKSQAKSDLGICEQGLSRAELSECLTAIAEHPCDAAMTERTAIDECTAASLCAPR